MGDADKNVRTPYKEPAKRSRRAALLSVFQHFSISAFTPNT
jgi:hypothetical protein